MWSTFLALLAFALACWQESVEYYPILNGISHRLLSILFMFQAFNTNLNALVTSVDVLCQYFVGSDADPGAAKAMFIKVMHAYFNLMPVYSNQESNEMVD